MSSMLSRFLSRQGKNIKNIARRNPNLAKLGQLGLGMWGLGKFAPNLSNLLGITKEAKGDPWYPGKMLEKIPGAGDFLKQVNPYGPAGSTHPGGDPKKNVPNLLGFQGQDFEQSGLGQLLSKIKQGGGDRAEALGKNLFGLEGAEARSTGLGLGLTTASQLAQFKGGYDKDLLRLYNKQLNPLTEASAALKDSADAYMDVNSPESMAVKESMRSDLMTGASDIADRAVSQSTGQYKDHAQRAMTSQALSDALGKTFSQYGAGIGDRYKTGVGLLGKVGDLNNAISQARMQNLIYAQQKQMEPWQYLGETGWGLMQRGLYKGMYGQHDFGEADKTEEETTSMLNPGSYDPNDMGYGGTFYG